MKKEFFIATILSALLVFAGSLLAPVEVRFVESITKSTTISGLLFGGASLALIALSYYIAKLSRRIGRRRTIVLGTVFGIVFALLYASVVNTLGILGVKFAWAFAVAATNPILAAYIQKVLVGNNQKGKFFGYYYAVQSIAGSAGAFLGGYIFALYGFSYVVYILAGTYTLSALAASFLPEQTVGKNSDGLYPKDHSVFALLKIVFDKPTLRFYLASNIPTGINWGVKPFLWPLVIFSISGSDVVTGSIFATMGVVAFFLLPFAGGVVDKIGPYRVLLLEVLLFAITGLVMAGTQMVAVFWIAAVFYTIAEVFNLSQAIILTEELDEDIRAEAMALDTALDQILGFTSPLLAGVLVSLSSPSAALGVFMGMYLVGFLFMVAISHKHGLWDKKVGI